MLMTELPIQVSPSLANVFGFNEAAMIQTIRFWLDPNSHPCFTLHFQDGRYWIPDLFQHLCQKFSFWHEEEIAYMGANFEQSGILIVLQNNPQDSGGGVGRATYHTLNLDLLKEKSAAPVNPVPAAPFVNDVLPSANGNVNAQSSFTVEVYIRGDKVYVLEARDPVHFLVCELSLEIQEAEDALRADEFSLREARSREVICHFPKIADDQLKEFVLHDPTLHNVLMGVFQMSILKHLILFCEEHKASTLVIFTDDAEADDLKLYQEFLALKDQNPTATKEKWGGQWGYREGESTGIGMIISANPGMFDAWLAFARSVTIRFRQILWREQKTNPSIHYYLQSRRLPEI